MESCVPVVLYVFSNPFNNPIRKISSANLLIQEILREHLLCAMLCSFLGSWV